MYDRVAEYIEDARTSLCIDLLNNVYARCMDELRSLGEGKFEHISQSLDYLRALFGQMHSRLVLFEDSPLDSPIAYGEGSPESMASARRLDEQAFHSAEQMGAFAHMAPDLNSTRRLVREIEQATEERSPRAPPRGPGATEPPKASDTQEWGPTGADHSRVAQQRR